MKLARAPQRQLEEFFREYFGDEKLKLPEIHLFIRRGAKFLTKLLKIHGITFGSRVFIAPKVIYRDGKHRLCIDKQLLAHEATHVLQYRRLGRLRFFYTYLKSFWKEFSAKEKWNFAARHEAYLAIPHEVEARACAAAFMEWLERKKNE